MYSKAVFLSIGTVIAPTTCSICWRSPKNLVFAFQAFHHAVEAYKIRRQLRAANTSTVTWINWWGFKAEAYDAIPENALLLKQAGASVSLHSDSKMVIQRYNHEAAQAYYQSQLLKSPLTRDQALQLVTSDAARVLGIDKQTGSVTTGKMADLVLWGGDPFSVYSRVEKVWVDGQLRYDAAKGRRPSDFELALVPRPPDMQKGAPPKVERRPIWNRPPAPRPRSVPKVSPGQPKTLAIVGGRVHGMAGPTSGRITIVIRGDRIVAVGPGIQPPTDAEVVDADNAHVTPGFIAAGSRLGLEEVSLEETAREHVSNTLAGPVRAALRVWEALNPHSATIPVTRLAGFTTTVVRPVGGLLSGQAAAFDLVGSVAQEANLVGPVAMYANLGLAGARAVGSRALALTHLRRLFADARDVRRYGPAIRARRHRKLSASLDDLRALIGVLEGRTPLIVAVDRAADILSLIGFATEQRVKLILEGAAEGWQVADNIAAAGIPVLVEVDSNAPFDFDRLGARFDNAARLHSAGVTVGFTAAGSAHNVRRLRQLAGIAVAWGLPHDAALAALTRVPATLFGLADRGVIKTGARANLVIWKGDPLELGSRVERMIIGGKSVPLTSRQTELRDRYRGQGS